MNPPSDPTKIPDLVSLFWTLGNVVTGFAVLQSLAFCYMTLQAHWLEKVRVPYVLAIVTAMKLLAIALEGVAVWWCHFTSLRFWSAPPAGVETVFKQAVWGRSVCVILFGLACLLAAWGPVIDQRLASKRRV